MKAICLLVAAVALCVRADDYLVIDCCPPYRATTYRLSADLPEGGLANRQYARTKLVLRRIPAQAKLGADFWMGVYPLTQEQCVRLTGQPSPSVWCEPEGVEPWTTGYGEPAERPVDSLSWIDLRGMDATATNGVSRRSVLGLIAARTGHVFDLPTEAQWEFACRAGTTTDHNCTGDPDTFGWFGWRGRGRYPGGRDHWGATHPVGLKKPNAWGLYDMHANVWEPCLDLFEAGSPLRVIRGGSYSNGPGDCRSGFRWKVNPGSAGSAQGVRLVMKIGGTR